MYLSPRSLSGRVSAAASSTPSHGAGRSTPRAAPPVDAEGYEDEISRLLGSIGLTDSPSSRSGLVSSGTPRSHGATGAEGGLPPPPKPLYGATLARSAATSYGVRHVDDDDDEGEESAGLLPRADYIPFIHPNKEAAHKELPASTTPASYLSAVRNNILAEYACFLKEARPEA